MEKLKVYAKINICLKIDGLYDDGFHRLDMILTSVDIADVLSFELCGDITVKMGQKPQGASNTAYRACEALERRGLIKGATVNIQKGIPFSAGLGGSSADAAAVIAAAQKMVGFDDSMAHSCAMEVGSDVAFMLKGGAARIKGKGEIIEPFDLKQLYAVVAKPQGGVSTPLCYKTFDELNRKHNNDTDKVLDALLRGEKPLLFNEMFEAATLINKDVAKLYAQMNALSDRVVMSGSGSAITAFFDSENDSIAAAKKINAPFVKAVKTVKQGIEFLS